MISEMDGLRLIHHSRWCDNSSSSSRTATTLRYHIISSLQAEYVCTARENRSWMCGEIDGGFWEISDGILSEQRGLGIVHELRWPNLWPYISLFLMAQSPFGTCLVIMHLAFGHSLSFLV